MFLGMVDDDIKNKKFSLDHVMGRRHVTGGGGTNKNPVKPGNNPVKLDTAQ